jgi:hypothetical protein
MFFPRESKEGAMKISGFCHFLGTKYPKNDKNPYPLKKTWKAGDKKGASQIGEQRVNYRHNV